MSERDPWLTAIAKTIKGFCVRWFRRRDLAVAQPRRHRARKNANKDAAFIHVTDVMALLPRCREMMMRLRKVDRDAFTFWKIIGARILGDRMAVECAMPIEHSSKGMVFWYQPNFKKLDEFPGTFIYFDQVKKNPWHCVVPTNSVKLFHVTIIWTDEPGSAANFGYSYYVSVNADNEMSLCSQRYLKRHRPGFVQVAWGHGPELEFHYREYKRRFPDSALSVDGFACRNFVIALSGWSRTAAGFQIRAERENISVSFNIPPEIAPRFFSDRDTTITTDGRRRRIFHAVREHQRIRDGRASTVAAHYRGERSFFWNGESITITPPERGFGKTFTLEGRILQEGEKVPTGWEALSTSRATLIRRAVEAEWRRKVASASDSIH